MIPLLQISARDHAFIYLYLLKVLLDNIHYYIICTSLTELKKKSLNSFLKCKI